MKIVASEVEPAATPTIGTGNASATVAATNSTAAPANAASGWRSSVVTAASTTTKAAETTGTTTSGSFATTTAGSRLGRINGGAESIAATPRRRRPTMPQQSLPATPQ